MQTDFCKKIYKIEAGHPLGYQTLRFPKRSTNYIA